MNDSTIQKIHLTEKASVAQGGGVYIFFVDIKANKTEIKKAVKKMYGVDAEDVRTVLGQKRAKRFKGLSAGKKEYKKAIVKLKEGQSIKLN